MKSKIQPRRFWRVLGAKAEKVRLAAEIIGQASKHYGGNYLSVGLRFLDVYAKRFSPSEMLELDLLDLSKSRRDIDEFISKDNMVQFQQRFNPVELWGQTENKLDFERQCLEAGLPCARTVAAVETLPRVSASLNGEELAGENAIYALASALPPGSYVIKPRDGALGRGVLVFSSGESGAEHVANKLKEHLEWHGDFYSWLVQPKLVNHEEVTRISRSLALQTVRLVTYVDAGGKLRILLAAWRLAEEHAEFDNFCGTSRKNVFCLINPTDGTVFKCCVKSCHPFGFGLPEVERHPVTGRVLIGIQPPMWNDVVELGKKAALAFLPSKCLGWDIAMTPAGPVLIEANRYWDPHNEDPRSMQNVLRYLRAECTKVDS